MEHSYLTIKERHRTEIKVVGSKFIGTVQPVANLEEAEAFLQEMRQEFWDASHNCYAFHINGTDIRYSDDGEPSNTAGKPIYDQIKGRSLLYTMVVVTRYFGGTKLGTGGMIRAYSESANTTLESAEIVEVVIKDTYQLKHSYDHTSLVMRSIQQYNASIVDTEYGNFVELTLKLPKSLSSTFETDLFNQSNGQITITRVK